MILFILRGQIKVKKKIRTAAASGWKVTDGEGEDGERVASWEVGGLHVAVCPYPAADICIL